MDYLDVANSGLIYILGSILIAFVLFQSFLFLYKAYKRGKEIGVSTKKMKQAIKSSITFSIVPSIPIVIALIAMVPKLGIPFPWIRLSIIGSMQYELIAAETGAKAMGLEGLNSALFSAQAFANVMWIMSIGIIWGLLTCILFLKKIEKSIQKQQKKDNTWLTILISSLFFGMISVFIGPVITSGGIPLLTMISSAAIMLVLSFLVEHYNIKWLKNFALSLSMIVGMALAILYKAIL